MPVEVSVPSLVIVGDEGEYNVWISLPDHDPVRDAFGFVIGCGETRDAAVADAVASLEGALHALQFSASGTARATAGRILPNVTRCDVWARNRP